MSLKIIDFSKGIKENHGFHDSQSSGWFKTRESVDSTPSLPPWTTWNGILECRRDSKEGKRILEMNVKTADPLLSGHSKEEWVRGIWIAENQNLRENNDQSKISEVMVNYEKELLHKIEIEAKNKRENELKRMFLPKVNL